MKDEALARLLLVKAVEEADRSGELLPIADRERATRSLRRETADPSTAHALGRLEIRSRPLFETLASRRPVLTELQRRASRVARGTSLLVPLVALLAGVPLGWSVGVERIHLLAFPFLGVIAWNLLVYLGLLVAPALRRRLGWRAGPQRAFARALRSIVERTSRIDRLLADAVARFGADWIEIRAPLLQARVATTLHLAAAALALGLVAGLYLAGTAVRYRVGWAAEWIGPELATRLLEVLYAPASALSGIPLPQDLRSVVAAGTTEGTVQDARPWIHLMALTLGLYVVLPRLLLALASAGLRLHRRSLRALPPALDAYARRTLGAALAGRGSGVVVALPCGLELDAARVAVLRRWLESSFGPGAALDVRAAIGYGDEAEALRERLADAPLGAQTEAVLAVFALAATPEAENHGQLLHALRAQLERAIPPLPLRVLVDESGYAQRMGGADAFERRLEERRRLWREFVRSHGLEAEFVDLSTR